MLNTTINNIKFEAPKTTTDMLQILLADKSDGAYRITLNNTEYSESGRGVRPHFIEVEKDNDGFVIYEMGNWMYGRNQKGDIDFITADYFNFRSGESFVERSYHFSAFTGDGPEASIENLKSLTSYFRMRSFDLPVVAELKRNDVA